MVRKTKKYKDTLNKRKNYYYDNIEGFGYDEDDFLSDEDDEKTFKKMTLENLIIKKYDVEKSENRLNLRITDTEKKILDTLKEKNIDFNVTEFIKKLILNYDSKITKEIVKTEYDKNYQERERLVRYLGRLENELNNIKNYKVASPELKKDITVYKKQLTKEKDVVLKNITSLENYLKKYSEFVQQAHKTKLKFKI